MGKRIITADLHLKNWSDKEYTEEGTPLRLMEILSVFNSMCEYAIKNEIDNIIVAGDINDTKSIVHVQAFSLFKKLLENYPGIHFDFIHGNHDAATGGGTNDKSAINLLTGPENVHIMLEPEVRDNITFVPWSKQMVDWIVDADPTDILITHVGLSDATLSSGISIRIMCRSTDLN